MSGGPAVARGRCGVVLVSWLLAGCYRGSVPAVALPDRVPVVPTRPFATSAAELGEPGVLEKIRHRVRVRRFGRGYLTPGGKPLLSSFQDLTFDRIFPVLDASGPLLQIVTEDDAARIATWIQSADTHETVTTQVRLQLAPDARYDATTRAGVWLEPGAPVEVTHRGRWHQLRMRDEQVAMMGFTPASTVGRVWVAPVGTHPVTLMTAGISDPFRPPIENGRQLNLAAGTRIHVRPDAASPVVARLLVRQPVAIIGEARGWVELELIRPYARIRGHVAVTNGEPEAPLFESVDGGFGQSLGMTHTDRMLVPAGTCLYESVDGAIIGVQISSSTRRGRRRIAQPGWSGVYVQMPWGHPLLYLRDTSSDPNQPSWEACSQ